MLFRSAPRMALSAGAHVAVIGGGPAGSLFALFALYYADQLGLDLRVTILEPRTFTRSGPVGCNMCAGLVPLRTLRLLDEIGLTLPERIICDRIGDYTLHTTVGHLRLPQPDPDGDVISVYRGQGPAGTPDSDEPGSFDAFLLDAACARGATVISERATAIALDPRPVVTTVRQSISNDLVVLATGVNRYPIEFSDLTFQAPKCRRMVQAEIRPGVEAVRAALGNSVHVFLPRSGSGIGFGTLVPKGAHINISVLSPEPSAATLRGFLDLPDVAAVLPEDSRRVCGCRPQIAIKPAAPLCADRFVAVGDAGVTRLYKNGIGTALQTARQAARTAIRHGASREAFRSHYVPFCRGISRDNRAGRLLFAGCRTLQRYDSLSHLFLHAINVEQNLPPDQRMHSRLLWGMFTGVYPYRQLLRMASHPRFHVSLLRHLLDLIVSRRARWDA